MEEPAKLGALAIGIILKETLPEALNMLKKSLYGYSDKNMGRMEAIREAYRECCYPYEKESNFYTVEPAAEKNTENNQPNVSYPVYFEMDKEHHTIPKLFFDGFKPNTKQRIWERRLGKTQLKTKIQDIIGYICEFQNCRDYEISSAIDLLNKAKEKIKSDNVFYYDPINMFCEELKYWLLLLSHAPLDEKTKQFIRHRINYLRTIHADQKSFGEVNQTAFLIAVKKIMQLLDGEIVPLIDLAISRKSAREYFADIILDANSLTRSSIELLFYVVKDAKKIPKGFSLEQIKTPNLESYTTALSNTSGQLLKHLVTGTLFSEMNMLSDKNNQASDDQIENASIRNIFNCQFIDEYYHAALPLFVEENCEQEWFKNGKSRPSGVLAVFADEQLMEIFIRCHGYVEKFCTFFLICDMIHDLTGDIGNLALYGMAASQLGKIFDEYENLKDRFIKDISVLVQRADQQYDDFNKKKNTEHEIWANYCYHHVGEAKSVIDEAIDNINANVKKIKDLSSHVNSPNYSSLLKKKIALLLEAVECFSGQNRIVSPPKVPFFDSVNDRQLFFKSESSALEFEEMSQKAIALYEENKYEEALDKFDLLLQKQPLSQGLLGYRINIHISQKQDKIAIADLTTLINELIRVNPRDVRLNEARENRARLLINVGSYQDAVADLQMVLEKNKNEELQDLCNNLLLKMSTTPEMFK